MKKSDQVESRIRPPHSDILPFLSMPKQIVVGSTAIVCLHDGREVEARITKIVTVWSGGGLILLLERSL